MGVSMEKLKNIVIIVVEIILAILIVVFVAVYIGASTTEKEYQKSITSINSGDWNNALNVIELIPHYKDSSELYIYIYPNNLFYENYKNIDDKLRSYKEAINYIHNEKSKLNNKTYKADFSELEKTLDFKINELNVKKQNDNMNTILNDSVAMIKKGDYASAVTKLNSISSNTMEPVKVELISYITFLNAVNLNDSKAIMKSIEALNPIYSGVLNNEINNEVQAYVDINKWGSIYKANTNVIPQNTGIIIGMKKNEVTQALGKPAYDNLIANKYGNFQTMGYENNRQFYFENNILKSFKE